MRVTYDVDVVDNDNINTTVYSGHDRIVALGAWSGYCQQPTTWLCYLYAQPFQQRQRQTLRAYTARPCSGSQVVDFEQEEV